MAPNNQTSSGPRTTAGNPKFSIPDNTFIAVEHPFKIKNPDKAIESLGGDRKISRFVAARDSPTFETQLSLHPGRYQHNAVVSSNCTAKSLVCQITVPRIIGKKRKRPNGDLSFDIEPHGLSEQQRMMQSMKDHATQCEMQILGQYNRVHKFRTLPDFAWSHQRNKFMHMFHESMVPLTFEGVKKFKLADNNPEIELDSDLVAPPLFSPATIPFNYAYQQNNTVKLVVGDDGAMKTINENRMKKSAVQRVPLNCDRVPTGQTAGGPRLEDESQELQDFVKELQEFYAERPIWSRRAAFYRFQDHKCLPNLKWMFQYVGYEFATGPWAMAVIRYGVDPRKDPEYRKYQSITLHFEPQPRHHPNQPQQAHRGGSRHLGRKVERNDPNGVAGYIFTGQGLAPDGKTWQVCDIQDPILKAVAETKNLRSEPEMTSDGWYKNGTWAKIKVILRYKARCLLNQGLSFEEEDYIQALEMPDEFDPSMRELPIDTSQWSKKAILLGYHIKNTALQIGKDRTEFVSHDIGRMVKETLAKKNGARSIAVEDDQELAELLAGDEDVVDEDENAVEDGQEDDEQDEVEDEMIEDED